MTGTSPDLRGRRGPGPRKDEGSLTVAYVMSRFPKVSETFVLREIVALEAIGVQVELYPLLREREPVVHPEAEPLVLRAHYLPFVSRPILGSHLWFLWRRPGTYLRTLWDVLHGTWGSANFLVGALGTFPKAVHAARLMATTGVDHVHCHFATHPALAGFVVRRLTGIPFSFTAHGSDIHVDRHMLCRKVQEAAFVVPISAFNRNVILDECDGAHAEKLVVVHCGVDTTVLRPSEGDVSQGGRGLEIICIGTLHEVKGQSYLVEACRKLVAGGIDLRCRLVGTGPDDSQLRREIADAGLDGIVTLVGACTQAEVAEILAEADVLVAPSVPTSQGKREGIPVVLIEAMSSGVPVIASALSGIPELVEHGRTGVLVPPRDATALAAALQRLLGEPSLRRSLAHAARETVVQDFDVNASARHLSALFRSSCSREGAACR